MGFDLRRGDDGLSVSIFTWVRAYSLAIEGGWEPQGTLPPPGCAASDWPGTYDSNDGQTITAEDAREMAVALDVMLTELKQSRAVERIPDDPVALWGGEVNASTYFGDRDKQRVLALLIEFLRGGTCQIT